MNYLSSLYLIFLIYEMGVIKKKNYLIRLLWRLNDIIDVTWFKNVSY